MLREKIRFKTMVVSFIPRGSTWQFLSSPSDIIFFSPPELSPRAFYNIIFTPRFLKRHHRIADTRYSPAGSNSVSSWKKRKIVTYRNQRESNSVERDDLDRNATRTMSLQDEIPVRIRMEPFGTIISRPCGFVGRYYPPRNSLRAFHRPQSKSSL